MKYSFSSLFNEAKTILSEIQRNLKQPNTQTTVVDPVLGEIDKIENDMNLLKGMMDYSSTLSNTNSGNRSHALTRQQCENQADD